MTFKLISMPLQKLFLSAAFTLSFALVQAQVDTAAISDKLNRSSKQLGKDIAVVIQKDGKTIYKKENAEFNLKTQSDVGAISQLLTAALVLTYVQEGKLSLDDKVSDYIPYFTKYSKGYITIRHCLTHQTGVQTDKLFGKSKYKTLEDEAMGIASRREIETNPGTEFKYSNHGYALVGRVLEVITKKSFDRIVQDRVLRPLGMRGSTFANENFNAAPSPFNGARSTANDLTNFLSMLLNKGKFNNKQVLTEESVNTLLSLQIPAGQLKNAPKGFETYPYTMGAWSLDELPKEAAVAVAAPSFSGPWAMADLNRRYTIVIMTKDLANPPAKEFYLDLKSILDEGVAGK